MFKIGSTVVYGTQGVCRIDCIETKQIGKQILEYYVLKPIFNENTAVFVPVENKQLTGKMQNVLTKAQIEELVKNSSCIDIIKTSDENQKREMYKSILSSGDRKMLIALVKTIRAERETRRLNNKRLNINDEQTLSKAEILLYNEFAFVYGVDPDEIRNIIEF